METEFQTDCLKMYMNNVKTEKKNSKHDYGNFLQYVMIFVIVISLTIIFLIYCCVRVDVLVIFLSFYVFFDKNTIYSLFIGMEKNSHVLLSSPIHVLQFNGHQYNKSDTLLLIELSITSLWNSNIQLFIVWNNLAKFVWKYKKPIKSK